MPYPGQDLKIENHLKGELDKARAEFQATSREFHSLITDIPSEIPSPDGDLRIRQTGEASRAALQKFSRALMRFSEYMLSGTVPNDLLPPE